MVGSVVNGAVCGEGHAARKKDARKEAAIAAISHLNWELDEDVDADMPELIWVGSSSEEDEDWDCV